MATRRRSRPTARPRPQPARTGPTIPSLYGRSLRFESLEDRRLLALVTVTTLDDSSDLNDGLTSLREAIFATNLVAGPDTIDFAPALTENGPATILLTQGELTITDSLTIEGPGADLLTIDASGSDITPNLKDGLGSRIFNIDDDTDSRMAVSINRLALTGGDVAGNGGAITSAENLTMTSVLVDDNAASSSIVYGGGVHSTGSLLLENCRIVNNLASGRSSYGGIFALAGITIRNSEISGNQGRTGGMYVRGGDVEITDTTISSNIGVGLEINGGNNTVNVLRTTVSENISSVGRGGMVLTVSSGGTALVSDSIFVGNTSPAPFGSGGGAYVSATAGGKATVDHTQFIENRGAFGGGMALSGSVHVIDSEFRGNVATGMYGDGGGLWVSSGNHSISSSTFLNNKADRDGGAIYVSGSGNLIPNIHLVGNTIVANQAGDRGGGVAVSATSGIVTISETIVRENAAAGSGGGVWIRADDSSRVRVVSSTMDANTAHIDGGGVAILALGQGEATLFQSTVSGNAANGSGGGLSITTSTGRAVVTHSTITLNRADANYNDLGLESGGGIFATATGTGRLHVTHTIVAGNLAPANFPPDLRNATNNLDLFYSLIGSSNGSGLMPTPVGSSDANGNLIGGVFSGFIVPQLGPLADNGGPTDTHALLPGSPAIDAGDPAAIAGENGAPLYDQRGEPFARVYGDRIDIGAFEAQPSPLSGDYNFNGVVDAADSLVWRKTRGSKLDLRADGDGNGQVDDADRTIWASNFGNTRESILTSGPATEAAAARPFVVETATAQTAEPLHGVASGAGLIPVTVTTLMDTVDLNDGLTSLREAIFATNLVAGADTIDFAPALTASGPATILLAQGELEITDSLTIEGPGAGLLTIDASGNDPTPDTDNGDGSRIFNIDDGTANLINVSLAGLTLTGGDVADRGGAILSRENLSLSAVTVADNSVNNEEPLMLGLGGGIWHADGHLVAAECTISNNSAGLGGGISLAGGQLSVTDSSVAENVAQSGAGLYNVRGHADIQRSTIRDNSAPGGFSLGGGIYTSGSLSVAATTISGNSAGYGGGLFSRTDVAGTNLTSISNSTISGNTALARGGGVRNALGTTVIEHSTITANTAPLGEGSGVASRGYNSAYTSIRATIVAGNTNSDIDFASGGFNSFQSEGENLISSGNALAAFAAPLDQAGIADPLLGPLVNNGGPTATHALLAGSPAINAGDLNAQSGVGGVPIYDQRGEPFDRFYGGRIDIGAFEYQAPSDLNLVVDTLGDESNGNYSQGDLSLREAIELANFWSGPDTIHFAPSLTAAGPATILLTHGELKITDSLTITGPGADLLTIDASGNDPTPDVNNGDGSRVFNVDDGDFRSTSNVSFGGLTLTGGDVSGGGGAITTSEVLTLLESTIAGNFAMTGGGIFSGSYSAVAGTLTVIRSVIENNSTSGNGGGVFASSRDPLTIVDTQILGNTAGLNGGGLFCDIFLGQAKVENSVVSNNTARRDGGGIGLPYGSLTIHGTMVLDNSAGRRGGGISAQGNLTINESSIIGNSANKASVVPLPSGGGGISASGNLVIAASTISGNTSNGIGAGVYHRGTATISGCAIIGNSAAYAGGGVFLGGNVTITNCNISRNTASGGAGIWSSGELAIVDSLISGNSADGSHASSYSTFARHGGGVRFYDGTLAVSGSTISGNSSSDDGGGVWGDWNANVTITNSTVSGNSASRGGGVWVTDGASISYTTIANNSAQDLGGGLFTQRGALELEHTIVAANSAPLGREATGLIGATIASKYSLIRWNAETGLAEAPVGSPDANGNLIGGPIHGIIVARLGPLADNGGPTMTHALLPGSPAIDAGDPAAIAGENGVQLYDERGEPFTRVYAGRIDIGAFEAQPNPLSGDYNFNGVVDAGDAVVWRKTRGSTTDLRADGNEDGRVDDADRAIWMANFGKNRAGELVFATSANAIMSQLQQPPALPGVDPVSKAETAITLMQARPPAEPGAVSFRVVAANRSATARSGDATVATTAVRQDAALLAWLATRTERDKLRLSANRRRPPDIQDELAVTRRADVLDYVFDAVGATAEL